jgi:gas vesicle protein GvpO
MANSESDDNGRLSAADLSRAALQTVAELTGYRPEAVTALEWEGEFWRVSVDALELERIPNTTDLLAEYEVELDGDGTLRGYRRRRRFMRGQASEG